MSKQTVSKVILIVTDFILGFSAIFFALGCLYLFTDDVYAFLPPEQIEEQLFIHFFLTAFCVIWFWVRLRHYTYRKPFWFELKEILRTLLIIAVIELATIAFSKLYFSRYLWGLTWCFSFLLVPLGRIVVKNILIRTAYFIKKTIIIGGGENAIDAYKALLSEPYLGFNVVYFITSEPSEKLNSLNVAILPDKNDSIWELVTKKSDQFILALEDYESEKRDRWLRYLSTQNYRSVSVIPTLRGLPLYSTDMAFLFSYDVILLRINNNLAKRSSRIIKRVVDVIGALSLIFVLSPFLAFLYFMICRDGGKGIYSHTRIGRNRKPFQCLKFRSMVVNSEEVLAELLENNPIAREEWNKDFKLKEDPRITRIGSFLRKYSLDELPQLFNVLRGEMSLVGPRPIVEQELIYYRDQSEYYLSAKPGMTGLWQVSGRNDVDYETRVYFDAWYVKNWSLWNDVVILLKTINVVLNKKGAY